MALSGLCLLNRLPPNKYSKSIFIIFHAVKIPLKLYLCIDGGGADVPRVRTYKAITNIKL